MKTQNPARVAWQNVARSAVLTVGFVVLLVLLAAGAYRLASQRVVDTDQVPAVATTPAMPVPYSPESIHASPSMDERMPGNARTPDETLLSNAEAVRSAVHAHPELFLSLVEAEPALANGQFLGFRVMPAADSEFFQLLGLRPGDILNAVNGITLEGPDQGLQLLSFTAGAPGLALTVWRDGQLQVLIY